MANENAVFEEQEVILESFDFDELEAKLQGQLEEELEELDFLKEEREKIANPDNLGKVIQGVVWEQFLNQIAVTAGEDFIKENNGLTLDLRSEKHIQTTENFANGNIATHNTKIDYQKRYDEVRQDFQTNPNAKPEGKSIRFNQETQVYERYDKNSQDWVEKTKYNKEMKLWEDKDSRTGEWQARLAKDARNKFDTRTKEQKGTKNLHKDHVISAAEQIRDMEAAAHLDRETRQNFAKSDVNLQDLDGAANSSKGDSRTKDWLDSKKDGKKPAERFPIDEEKMLEADKKAREEYDKMKKEGEQTSIKAGKQSQREEAFRIGGKALRAVLMQLLAELIKEIIAKLIKWFKSAKKNLESLLDSLKEAIHSFIGKMKTHLINAGNTVFSTVLTALIGPIFGTIKKVWMMLKQGWKALKDAVNYIKNPENKGKPIGRLMLETGKIVIAGMTGIGALVLGEVIEKELMAIPIFAVEIPLIGSLANILGVFFGAVVAGIIGAIAINLIQKRIEQEQKSENATAQINKGNDVLRTQHQLQAVSEVKFSQQKLETINEIKGRHQEAAEIMRESLESIEDNCKEDNTIEDTFGDVERLLAELGGE